MSRLNDFKSKHPEINWDVYSQVDFSKTKKYLGFIANAAKENANPEEIKELLVKFEKLSPSLQEKDINKYSFSSLKESLKDKKSIKDKKIEGSEFIGNCHGYDFILLKTFDAAKYYSAGTKWCISKKNVFNNYLYNNDIVVVGLNKQNPNYKIAFTINKKGNVDCFYNVKDRSYSVNDLKDSIFYIPSFIEDVNALCVQPVLKFKQENTKFWNEIKRNPAENLDLIIKFDLVKTLIDNDYYYLFSNRSFYHTSDVNFDFCKNKKMLGLYEKIISNRKKYSCFLKGNMHWYNLAVKKVEKRKIRKRKITRKK
jgi:hypothetical protein